MLELTAHLTELLRRLRLAVTAFAVVQARGPMVVLLGTQAFVQVVPPSPHRRIPVPVWNLLALRLGRLASRFTALVARWHAGTLPPARPRPAAAHRAAPPSGPPSLRLPRERGWINKRVDAAAVCAGMLQNLLQRADLARFLAEVPRAGRLLRPLCHALAVDLPPGLALPRRPRPPRPKPAAPAAPPDRTPPRYVLRAARHWREKPA